ncbi:MAG: hypothetical protein KAH22_10335 [Thiotrichaceae bacterium]|nr:hypothetical protein [Thiotrichaceae bacterium]
MSKWFISIQLLSLLALLIFSHQAKSYMPAQDMQINRISTHHSSSKNTSLTHSLSKADNRLLLIAVSSEGASKHKLRIGKQLIPPVPKSYTQVKSWNTHCTSEFFYLLEKDLPRQATITISVESNATNLNIAAMTFDHIEQKVPRTIASNTSKDPELITTKLPAQPNHSLIIDALCVGQGLPRGQLEATKNQDIIFHIGDPNERGAQMSGSFQRSSGRSVLKSSWRWQRKTRTSNRISQTVVAIQPLKFASTLLSAGDDQHLYYWQGPIAVKNTHPLPHYLLKQSNPSFSTETIRISSKKMSGYDGNSHTLQHMYAKDQPWNSNQRYYKLKFGQIRDARTHQPIASISMDKSTGKKYTEILWSNINPKQLYGLHKNTLNRYSLKTRQWKVVHSFQESGILTANFEGNLSADDRYIALNDGAYVWLYDIHKTRIAAKMAAPKNLDWMSVSQSGKYIISNEGRYGVKLYNMQFQKLRHLAHKGDHADIGYDASGDEVYVQTCPASMTRLKDGKKTDLLGLSYFCGHVSTRNIKQPGWAYFSARPDPKDNHYGTALKAELLAVKLDKSQTVKHLGKHYSSFSAYDRQAKMVVSPDGSQVMFNSDWGQREGNIYAYTLHQALAPNQFSAQLNAQLDFSIKGSELHWSKVSGKGEVIFNDASSRNTKAIFSQNGRYVLRLEAQTAQGVISDEVVIQIGAYSYKEDRSVNDKVELNQH